jgi:hypothetical protein
MGIADAGFGPSMLVNGLYVEDIERWETTRLSQD